MQNQASADLMAIGKHCAFPECGQLDFLPFECGCGATFCLEHRQPAAHGCRLANREDCRQVIVCPLCAQGVELAPSDDPNAVFDRHQRAGCDPANYARVHKKPKCPVKGCKEKLTTINTYTCKDCRQTVCLKHRLSIDHACAGPAVGGAGASAAAGQRAAAAFAAAAAASRSFGNRASTMVSELAAAASGAARGGAAGGAGGSNNNGSAAAQQRQQRAAARTRQQQQRAAEDPANSVHGSAQRRQQLLQQQGAEACPQCGAVFSDVQALILHVDRAHTGAGGGAAAAPAAGGQQRRRGDDVFVCPRCSLQFADPALLVTHSESCGRRDTGSCALS